MRLTAMVPRTLPPRPSGLGLDSELLFVGDADTTEAGRPSRRAGLEWTNYARLGPWLQADASVSSRAITLWNAEAAVHLSRRARIVLQGFNLFNSKVADIDYFYRSRLPGEPADGVDDVHTHPALPRSLRLALHVAF